jgi:putative SOS response-associated peptidase YedK
MCARFTQHYTWREAQAFLQVFGEDHIPRNLPPRHDIAPTTFIDVVTSRIRNREIVGREMVPMRWGLIPTWWKKPRKEVPATFNARAETVAERPMFRGAFRHRRCIIPASGFYAWTDNQGERQPYLFTAADDAPILALAGLWDRWIDPDNFDEVISATIIVSDLSVWMTAFRSPMPVLLETHDFDGWLDGSVGTEVLKPVAEGSLRKQPISPQFFARDARHVGDRQGTGKRHP